MAPAMTEQSLINLLKLDRLTIQRCEGLRRDGQPCNNPVAQASCARAKSVLRHILDNPARSPETSDDLRELAEWLLCKRWHQDQWPRLVDRWITILEEREKSIRAAELQRRSQRAEAHAARQPMSRESNQARRADPQQRERSTEHRPVPHSGESGPYSRTYERLIEAISRSNITIEAKANILRAVFAEEDEDNNQYSDPDSDGDSVQHSAQNSNQDSDNDNNDNPATDDESDTNLTSRDDEANDPRRTSIAPRSDRGRRASLDQAARTSTATSQRRSRDRCPVQRHSYDECGICLESYDRDDDNSDGHWWECTTCQNRTHADCFAIWRAQQGSNTNCVYCRETV